ncbi:MAG TPA: PQQ-binding-like beta-propeller repeat protein [Urbifossiella sp.]
MRSILTLVILAGVSLALAADWPQFHGPTRDNQSTETGLNWNWPKDGPPIAWKLDVGSGWSGPVVAGERLIAFHRVANEEIVLCLEPATGKELWKFAYRTRYRDDFGFDDGPRSTPLISGDKVFTLGANGDLHGLELATGKKLWSRNLLVDYDAGKGFFGVACSPIVAAGKLLVNVGGRGAGIVAFDPATGKELWKANNDAASYSSPTIAPIDGKTLAIFLTREGLVALEPETGKTRFSFPWRPRLNESVNAATPLVWKNDIFVTVSYGAGAVLLRPKGEELEEVWANDKSMSCQFNTPVRVGDYLYGSHGRVDAKNVDLRCVEWKTGAVKWSRPKYGATSLIAVDGGLLGVIESGEVVRFEASPESYQEKARATILGSPTRAAPALADGRLFARDGKTLICVKLK